MPLVDAPGDAASVLWSMTSGTFGALADMGSSSGRGQVSSTVGIVRYTADVADIGAAYYLTVIALISLSLAIFNLLPLLPLDGGHVLFIISSGCAAGRSRAARSSGRRWSASR